MQLYLGQHGQFLCVRQRVPHAHAVLPLCKHASAPLVLCPTRVHNSCQPCSRQSKRSLTAVSVAGPTTEQPPAEQTQEHSPGVLAPAFHGLGVDAACLPGLAKMGITQPSAIQEAAIQRILSGSNIAIQSYTGSGKTLAYLLPAITLALQRAEAIAKSKPREVPLQVLIVAPNQELAIQIVRVAQSVLPDAARKMVQQCIGGANINNQQAALERNHPIIVAGTPGRLAQLMRMGTLRVHRTPLLILDEADQLLAPHFREDMYHITAQTGKRLSPEPERPGAADGGGAAAANGGHSTENNLGEAAATNGAGFVAQSGDGGGLLRGSRQTVMASATLTETVLAKTSSWCPSPVYTTAGPAPVIDPTATPQRGSQPRQSAPGWGWGLKGWDGPASPLTGPRTQGSAGGVEQDELVPAMPPQLKHMYIVASGEGRKADTLRRAVHALDLNRVLIFMNFQQRLKDFQFKLEASKMKVATLHGELTKVQRANILNDFRRDRLRALMVSDLVARGLDLSNCDAVFNAELPSSAAHYAHRAGRTGRMGAPGSVISLVTPSNAWVIGKLSKRLGVPIQEVHVANGQLHPGPPPEAVAAKRSKSREASASASPSRSPSPVPESSDASSSKGSSSSLSASSGASSASTSSQPQPPMPVHERHRQRGRGGSRSPEPSGAGLQGAHGEVMSGGASADQGMQGGGDDVEVIVDEEDEVDDADFGEEERAQQREGASVRGRGADDGSVGSVGVSGGRGGRQRRGVAVGGTSRAERRALKFGGQGVEGAAMGSEVQGTAGGGGLEGASSSSSSSRGGAGSGSVSSRVKEDLLRELDALREERALVRGKGGKGRRSKLAKK